MAGGGCDGDGCFDPYTALESSNFQPLAEQTNLAWVIKFTILYKNETFRPLDSVYQS